MALVGFLAAGCAIEAPEGSRDPALTIEQHPIVYGPDDRHEYFEAEAEPFRTRISESVVALVPAGALRGEGGVAVTVDAPSFGEREGLCPGERFAEQPAAAFCSGVLVDWDLVLTAGHCARVLPLDEIAVVFDYDYARPGVLALGADTRRVVKIVAEALDDDNADPRLDYAWLKLDRPVLPPRRRPAPMRIGDEPLRANDVVTFLGSVGGTPAKVALGATVEDPRATTADYFVADTDTSHGSSGGALFDRELRLVGLLARGKDDFAESPAGCAVTVRQADAEAGEEFTYVQRAVEGICFEELRSMCNLMPLPPGAGGCSMGPGSGAAAPPYPLLVMALVAVVLAMMRRQSRGGQPSISVCQLPAEHPIS